MNCLYSLLLFSTCGVSTCVLVNTLLLRNAPTALFMLEVHALQIIHSIDREGEGWGVGGRGMEGRERENSQ